MLMGAHKATLACATNPTLDIVIILVLSFVFMSFGALDSDALLKFKEGLVGNTDALSNWNAAVKPCEWNRTNWVGVVCLNGSVWGLQLEHMKLSGTIDVDALVALPSFRTLSLMDNKFDGSLPNIKKLGKIKALYLSNNRFSGDIPGNAFEGMGSLKRVYLANNGFTGTIPISLTTLPKLTELRLEGNQFQGQIPYFKQKGLAMVNLASNELEGPIPASLSDLNPNSFSGNKGLCGLPLGPCNLAPPPTPTPAPKKKSNILKIIIIVIIVLIVLAALEVALFLLYQKNQKLKLERSTSSVAGSFGDEQLQHDLPATGGHIRKADHGKLMFLRDDVDKFDLHDLLRASAEVLGSGTFGSSYKAVVSGQALVVKRYRHMNNVGREEFHEHMRRIGRLRHPNLLPLLGYYYRKEEKLLVTEFVENGSLASHLHGNHSVEDQGLDWHTRLKIIKGVAKGLDYLYSELPIMVPYGHLKSSNVLLDDSFEPLLTDYALRHVINPEHAHTLMMAYKSPEYAQKGRISNKTDIWSFGILILEILTGKFPENYLTPSYNSNADLATWVNNMVTEKRTSEVFDKEMIGTKDSKGEMINLLKIGLSCCENDAERRLDIEEVVEKIQQLKEGDSDEECYGNERNSFSVRGIEDDMSSPENR